LRGIGKASVGGGIKLTFLFLLIKWVSKEEKDCFGSLFTIRDLT